jgi:DUF4097 and DUF4098 domain-containing protein YvlB
MQDKLKQFVEDHRAAFDKADAPQIFAGIQMGMQSKPALKFFTKYAKMINYGFGASALVVASALSIYLLREPALPKVSQTVETKTSTVLDTVNSKTEIALQLSSGVAKKTQSQESPSVAYFSPPDSVVSTTPAMASPPPLPNAQSVPPVESEMAATGSTQNVDTSFANVKRLVLRMQYCDVQLQGNEGTGLQLSGTMSESAGNMLVLGRKCYVTDQNVLRYSLDGTTLQVWIEQSKLDKRKKIEYSNVPSVVRIKVPANIDIDIENNSGNISLCQLQAHEAKIETKFGHVTLTNVTASLQVKTNSGHLKATDLIGNIKATDNFGNVHLSNVKGNVEVVCHSGNVVLSEVLGSCDVKTSFGNQKYATITGDIKAVSASGSIHFLTVIGAINCTSSFGSQVYDQVKGDIVAQASSGNIKLNQTKGSLLLNTSFGNIKGEGITLVAGAQLKASSGAIQIDFTNDFKELRFDLNSSSGKIKLEDNGTVSVSDDELKSGTGSLLVSGTTTFGNQFYH